MESGFRLVDADLLIAAGDSERHCGTLSAEVPCGSTVNADNFVVRESLYCHVSSYPSEAALFYDADETVVLSIPNTGRKIRST